MKKILCLLLAMLMLGVCFVSCDEKKEEEAVDRIAPTMESLDFSVIDDISKVSESTTETDYVIINISINGNEARPVVVRLFPDVAPATVKNFKKLVSEKFYDGIIFHRVIENFMIQGGDPDGDGMGGSKDTIKGEFTTNGFENNLLHKRGVVSMARTNDPDSASSQFFIMHKDYPSLDGKYASFGYVVYGMDVVDDIAEMRTISDRPVFDVVMTSVRFAKVAE